MRFAQNVSIRNLKLNTTSISSAYQVQADRVVGKGLTADAVIAGFSFVRKAELSNIQVSGARSYRDNANLKMMSPIDVTLTNVTSYNSAPTGIEGNYAIYSDFLYTPYNGWAQNVRYANLNGAKPNKGDRAIWLTGIRNSQGNGIYTTGNFLVSLSSNNRFSNVTAQKGIYFEQAERQQLSGFIASHMRLMESETISLRSGSFE